MYNIDYLLNLAYDYYYNKNNKRNIQIIDIEEKDCNDLNNIKIIPENNKITSYVNDIFNTTINFLYKKDMNYYFLRIGIYNSLLVIRKYDNENIINDMTNEDNNNKKFNFLLSDFLTKKLTKHIIIPIRFIDIPASKLLLFLKNYNNLDNLYNYNGTLSISIYENFYKMTTLYEYITNNNFKDISDIYNMLFQIIYTLTIIRQKYNNFCHNLLNIDNIFIYYTSVNDHIFKYEYNNKIFNIKNRGFIIKIANFELSNINSIENNDIKTLFNSLFKLKNKLIISIKNNIIKYINMKPENIMNNKSFLDNFEFSDEHVTKVDTIQGNRDLKYYVGRK